jgi:ribosomal protein S18 acetylase RimI-like enzyme
VAVNPNLRRCGIGAALMRYVEKGLAEMGCPKLNLQVRAENREVVAFYESLGYNVEERVSMGKRLTQDK